MGMQDEQTDALIIGGGPTGLAAAIELADQGIAPLALERRPRLSRHPRATALTAEAMRLMTRWGVADEVCRYGVPSGPALFGRAGLAGPELQRLPPHEQVWSCPRGRLEEILSIRALAGGAEVRYGTQLIGLCHATGAVAATAATTDGVAGHILARYVVGADGVHSVVRQFCGIAAEQAGAGRALLAGNAAGKAPTGAATTAVSTTAVSTTGPDLSLALQDGAAAGAAIARALATGDEPGELTGYRPQQWHPSAAERPHPAPPRIRELLRG